MALQYKRDFKQNVLASKELFEEYKQRLSSEASIKMGQLNMASLILGILVS